MREEMDQFNLIFAMRAVAKVLEAPRDRLGRLDVAVASEEIREARETVRGLAVHYGVTGGKDIMEQCAKVLQASISSVEAR